MHQHQDDSEPWENLEDEDEWRSVKLRVELMDERRYPRAFEEISEIDEDSEIDEIMDFKQLKVKRGSVSIFESSQVLNADILKENMLNAVLSNSIASVRTCIDSGAPLDAFYEHRKLLHHAIAENHVDVVRILLYHGANPHLLDPYKRSPLQLAVIRGSSKIVDLLLKAGANVRYISRLNRNKQTILHEAVTHGNVAIIELLLGHGANINAVDVRGIDVLGYAAIGYSNPSWNNRAARASFSGVFRILPP